MFHNSGYIVFRDQIPDTYEDQNRGRTCGPSFNFALRRHLPKRLIFFAALYSATLSSSDICSYYPDDDIYIAVITGYLDDAIHMKDHLVISLFVSADLNCFHSN